MIRAKGDEEKAEEELKKLKAARAEKK